MTTGCEAPKGVPVEYGSACNAENDKKTIETIGYLDTSFGLYCSNTGGRLDCGFKLKQDLKDEKGFSADVAVASGANSMDKPERGFEMSDLKVRGNDGNEIDLSKKVTVTGKLNSSKDPVSKDLVCYMKVYKIEQ